MPMRVIGAGWDIKRDNGAAFLVQDTFTDANGTLISAHTPETRPGTNTWATQVGPEWQINNNILEGTGTAEARTDIDSGASNVDVQGSVIISGAEGAGVSWRAAGTNNKMLAFVYNSATEGYYLYKEVAGSYTSLASKAVTINLQTYVVRGTVNASDLHTMYVDGVSELTATDSAGATNTRVGFYCNSGRHDFDTYTCYAIGDRP